MGGDWDRIYEMNWYKPYSYTFNEVEVLSIPERQSIRRPGLWYISLVYHYHSLPQDSWPVQQAGVWTSKLSISSPTP